jgi:hypothetical protein
VIAVSDATAVYEPFAAGRYQQAQDDALSYLRTWYPGLSRTLNPMPLAA